LILKGFFIIKKNKKAYYSPIFWLQITRLYLIVLSPAQVLLAHNKQQILGLSEGLR